MNFFCWKLSKKIFCIGNFFFDFINFCENFNLHCALKSLSAIEQEVLFLLYSKELSQEEVANILNICSKSVSRIKLRAFDKIRKFLKGEK